MSVQKKQTKSRKWRPRRKNTGEFRRVTTFTSIRHVNGTLALGIVHFSHRNHSTERHENSGSIPHMHEVNNEQAASLQFGALHVALPECCGGCVTAHETSGLKWVSCIPSKCFEVTSTKSIPLNLSSTRATSTRLQVIFDGLNRILKLYRSNLDFFTFERVFLPRSGVVEGRLLGRVVPFSRKIFKYDPVQ